MRKSEKKHLEFLGEDLKQSDLKRRSKECTCRKTFELAETLSNTLLTVLRGLIQNKWFKINIEDKDKK